MVLQLGVVYGFVALGIFFTFRALNFADMTVDGSFAIGGCVASVLLRSGIPQWLAIAVACSGSAAAGCATAFLHVKFRIAEILSGIVVASACYSVCLRIMGGSPNIMVDAPNFSPALIFTICAATVPIVGYLLRTDFGLAFRCAGLNRTLARSHGICPSSMLYFGLAVGNGFAGVGGAFFCLSQGFCDVGSGSGTLIAGLASLVVGEAIFPLRSAYGKVFACFVGSVAYRAAIAMALHSELPFLRVGDFNLITGGIIVLFLAAKWRRKPC
ncbi:MAG: hypothetical protein LBI39_02460 [Puniceicoccales bacterium]|jgi:putative ABC transport system permease protein|nr:hypothetical protein [Puniceicoccales bacterium]